jgi:hypothetical protein
MWRMKDVARGCPGQGGVMAWNVPEPKHGFMDFGQKENYSPEKRIFHLIIGQIRVLFTYGRVEE